MKRIEPAARLVNGFADIVRRKLIVELLLIFQRVTPLSVRHGAGIKPDVHYIRLFPELTALTMGAKRQFPEDLFRRKAPPAVGTLAAEKVLDLPDPRGISHYTLASLAIESGYGDSPDSLSTDAPVGSLLDHVGDPFLAPFGYPLDLVDLIEGIILESIDRDEPRSGPGSPY